MGLDGTCRRLKHDFRLSVTRALLDSVFQRKFTLCRCAVPKISASGCFAGFGGRRLVAVLHHLFVQPADTVAAGAYEQEGKQGMYEAGDASGQQGGREARCLSQVLRIGLSNFLQMIGQSIHPISLIPII